MPDSSTSMCNLRSLIFSPTYTIYFFILRLIKINPGFVIYDNFSQTFWTFASLPWYKVRSCEAVFNQSLLCSDDNKWGKAVLQHLISINTVCLGLSAKTGRVSTVILFNQTPSDFLNPLLNNAGCVPVLSSSMDPTGRFACSMSCVCIYLSFSISIL